MDNIKINKMLAAANGANHVGEYPESKYSPMSNKVGTIHAVCDLQEILELAAQVELLRRGLNQAIELLVTALVEPEQITDSEIIELRDIDQSTPERCLAEVKAQAGRSGFIAGAMQATVCAAANADFFYYQKADEYANQLRQSAKGER